MSPLVRRASALVLVALAASPQPSAQGAGVDAGLSARHLGGVHVVKAGPDGGVVCDLATETELATALAVEQMPVRLTVVPPVAQARAPVSNFRIVLRATDQLLERPEALQAFRRAAARWERVIQSELTVVIDVDYGPERFGSGEYDPGVIASANSSLQFFSGTGGPAEVVAQLKGRNQGNAQLQALYNAIPVPTPSTAPDGTGGQNLGRAIGGLIPLQALGVRAAFTDADPDVNPFGTVPNIGFNSAFNYDFDPNDGIGAGQTDFEAVVAHEIGHALAFTSAIGFTVSPPYFTPWDLFRVRPEAVTPGEPLTDGVGWETALRVVTPGPANTQVLAVEDGRTYFAPVQVTFDGNNEYETSTATGSRSGGDGQQASHWRDDALRPPSLGAARKIGIMDPTIGAGERIDLSEADIRLLQLTGFEVTFAPVTATVALTVDGRPITESLIVPERSVGDVAVGATREVPIELQNADAANPLNYEVQVVVDAVFPAGVSPTTRVAPADGTVGPSGTATLALTVGGVDQPAFVAGRLQVRTNDASRAFIEVPFTYSVDGAREPTLAVTSTLPPGGDLGDIAAGGARTFSLGLENTGSLPLDYVLYTSLARREFDLSSAPTSRRRAPLFAAAFESPADLSQFVFDAEGAPDRWRVTSGGRAALAGHSAPNAAYFGSADGGLVYSNNSFGQLTTRDIDVSGLDPSDLVQLSFRYFLKAEAGFDIASVLVSADGGASYRVVATSDGGVLQNTIGADNSDPRWEGVTVDVPGVAGLRQPLKVAFRFESDANVTDEGWYLDDVAVDVVAGGSGFFASPVDGTLAGDASETVAVTVNGAALDRGFYRGAVEVATNQRTDGPPPTPVSFTVGNPTFPTIETPGGPPTVSVNADTRTPFSLSVRNPGDAPLSFVRVLEPAASDYEGSRTALTAGVRPKGDATAAATADVGATAELVGEPSAMLAQVDLPGAALPGDITQLPDGRVLVVDIGLGSVGAGTYGQTFLLSADLGSVVVIPSPEPVTTQVGGLAYNARTGTLWMLELSRGLLREFRLDETAAAALVPTDRTVDLGFGAYGLTYSPELDAFLTTPFGSTVMLAVDVEGDVLPGYPVDVAGRTADSNVLPGLSITEGVVEIGGTNRSIVQVGQFGRSYAEAQTVTVASASIGGSPRINGYLRSRVDPNGVAYYVTNPGQGVPPRVFSVDPPDIAPALFTRVEALEPLYADQSVAPDETFSLDLLITSDGLDLGSTSDEIAFLTNSPAQPLVRVPVEVSVAPVANEPAGSGAFALLPAAPNPTRSAARVQFELPAPTAVTVDVYNALGQRVAVLADAVEMTAGPQRVTFEAGALAAGLYIVRVQAGDQVATQKLTVLR